MRKLRDDIAVGLRAFKQGIINLDEAVDYIFTMFSKSKRFHYSSFILGVSVGALLIIIGVKLFKVPL